ncbi:MAG TPA: MBL fold metallo-hydrolase [Chthoniobacterales bacterium]|nr:MBL fold metallo-hydrolase [Chthoniobacterales bacterium]
MQSSPLIALIAVFGFSSCTSYHPLADKCLRRPIGRSLDRDSAVKVTFLGNSTLVVQDKETTLLVDGFLSRPGPIQTVLGTVGPSLKLIEDELTAVGVHEVDAVLVGHAHHDHALDATAIADRYDSKAIGSASYGQIYRGSHVPGNKSSFVPIARTGGKEEIGRFRVHFVPSIHVAPCSFIQRMIEGEIKRPLKTPAHFTRFKCGDVFALYIEHLDKPKKRVTERIAVTTTAGAIPGALQGLTSPAVLFLSVGYLAKESEDRQDAYWENTVNATRPRVIVPVHWDDFARKLSKGLEPAKGLAGSTKDAMTFVKRKADGRKLRVLDTRESMWISQGDVYCPAPAANATQR